MKTTITSVSVLALLLAVAFTTPETMAKPNYFLRQVKPPKNDDKDETDEGHPADEPTIIDDDDEEVLPDYSESYVKYYLNGMKGFWTGFSRGFYHDSQL